MSRDVLSNALLLRAIAGVDGLDDRQRAGTPFPAQVPDYSTLLSAGALLTVNGMRKLWIGVLREGFEMPEMDSRVAECVKRAAAKFAEMGAEVVDVSVPGHAGAPALGRAYRYEMSHESHWNTFGPRSTLADSRRPTICLGGAAERGRCI